MNGHTFAKLPSFQSTDTLECAVKVEQEGKQHQSRANKSPRIDCYLIHIHTYTTHFSSIIIVNQRQLQCIIFRCWRFAIMDLLAATIFIVAKSIVWCAYPGCKCIHYSHSFWIAFCWQFGLHLTALTRWIRSYIYHVHTAYIVVDGHAKLSLFVPIFRVQICKSRFSAYKWPLALHFEMGWNVMRDPRIDDFVWFSITSTQCSVLVISQSLCVRWFEMFWQLLNGRCDAP